uniref:ANK_REP_REGION domain-containing protein n=1 Tax=Macrostomum lignano TaxID=282301 RepID=A0A1I8FKU2_9PLAT
MTLKCVERSDPVHLAAFERPVGDCSRFLSMLGADVGSLEIVDLLLERGPTHWPGWHRDRAGILPVHLASETGHLDVIKRFLDIGVDQSSDVLPLHMACEKGNAECARLLVEAGSPLDATLFRNRRGNITTLPWPLRRNNPEVLPAPMSTFKDGIAAAPLHISCQRGYHEHLLPAVVAILAQREHRHIQRRHPLSISCRRTGHFDMAMWLIARATCGFGHLQIVKLLLQNGADVHHGENFEGRRGIASIHCAAIRGRHHVIPLLRKFGANLNATDEQGWSPLQLGLCHEHFTILCCCWLQKWRRPQAANQDGQRPIQNGHNATTSLRSGAVRSATAERCPSAGSNAAAMQALLDEFCSSFNFCVAQAVGQGYGPLFQPLTTSIRIATMVATEKLIFVCLLGHGRLSLLLRKEVKAVDRQRHSTMVTTAKALCPSSRHRSPHGVMLSTDGTTTQARPTSNAPPFRTSKRAALADFKRAALRTSNAPPLADFKRAALSDFKRPSSRTSNAPPYRLQTCRPSDFKRAALADFKRAAHPAWRHGKQHHRQASESRMSPPTKPSP